MPRSLYALVFRTLAGGCHHAARQRWMQDRTCRKRGKGGSSLAFKLGFAGDVAGYFKPEQTFAPNWYSEAASYYLDRELGMGRVPPTVGRRIEWESFALSCGQGRKLAEVVIRRGTVRGSAVYWIPDKPEPMQLVANRDRWGGGGPSERARSSATASSRSRA